MTTKQQKRKHFAFYLDTIDGSTAYYSGAEEIANLHTLMEAINSGDGSKIKITQMKIHLRVYSDEPFAIAPLIVQSAGTFSEVKDVADNIVDIVLDAAVDDMYGSQMLGPTSVARRTPVNDPTSSPQTMTFAIEVTRLLPGNLLNIINKELETERLQSMRLGYFAKQGPAASMISVYTIIETDFVTVRKGIVTR